MDPVTGTLLMGGLGGIGQWMTNQGNTRMSREQMRFQERMSSTAAQRAVRDYQMAGLNPALAYDRPASSPGGASAVLGNVVGEGVATAQEARRLSSELKLQSAQTNLVGHQDQAAQVAARVATNTESERTKTELNALRRERELKDLEVVLRKAMVPGAQADAAFANALGAAGPAIRMLLPFVGPLAGLFRKAPKVQGTRTSISSGSGYKIIDRTPLPER